MRSVWFYMNAALSDAALIYRCWKVYHDAKPYHRAIVVIVPTILWAACISFASMIIYYLSTVDASTTIPMIPQLQPFLYSFYVTTVVLNLFTTGLIISKCWERHQDNSGDTYLPTRKRLNFADIIRITVESALLYTTTVVFCVVLDLARTNAYYGITDISLEAAGISFDLMIIRIWTGASTELTNLKFSGAVLIEAQRGAGGRLCSLSNRAGGCGCRHSNRTSALPIANEGGGGEELQGIPMGHHNHANDDEVHGTAALRYFTAPGRCLVIDHSQDARTRLHCRNSLRMDVKWRDGDGESQVV